MAANNNAPSAANPPTGPMSSSELQKLTEECKKLQNRIRRLQEDGRGLQKSAGVSQDYKPQLDYGAEGSPFKKLLAEIKANFRKKMDSATADSFCDISLNKILEEIHGDMISGNTADIALWNKKIEQLFEGLKSSLKTRKTDFLSNEADKQLDAQGKLVDEFVNDNQVFPLEASEVTKLNTQLSAARQAQKETDDLTKDISGKRDVHQKRMEEYRDHVVDLRNISQREAHCVGQLPELLNNPALAEIKQVIDDRLQMYEAHRTGSWNKPLPTQANLDAKKKEMEQEQDELARFRLEQEYEILEDQISLDKIKKFKANCPPSLKDMQETVDAYNAQLNAAAQGKPFNMGVAAEVIRRELGKPVDPAKPASLENMLESLAEKLREQLSKIIDNSANQNDPEKQKVFQALGDVANASPEMLLEKVMPAFRNKFHAEDVEHWANLLSLVQAVNQKKLPEAELLIKLQPYLLDQFDRVKNGVVKDEYTPLQGQGAELDEALKKRKETQDELTQSLNAYKDRLQAGLSRASDANKPIIQDRVKRIGEIKPLDQANQQRDDLIKELDEVQLKTKRALEEQAKANYGAFDNHVNTMRNLLIRKQLGLDKGIRMHPGTEGAERSSPGVGQGPGVPGLNLPQNGNMTYEYSDGVFTRGWSAFAIVYNRETKDGKTVYSATPKFEGNIFQYIGYKGLDALTSLIPFISLSSLEYKHGFKEALKHLLMNPNIKILDIVSLDTSKMDKTKSSHRESVFRSLQTMLSVGEEMLGIDSLSIGYLGMGLGSLGFSRSGGSTKDKEFKYPLAFTIDRNKLINQLQKYYSEGWINLSQLRHLTKRLDRFPDYQEQKQILGDSLADTVNPNPSAPPAPLLPAKSAGPSASNPGNNNEAKIEADEDKNEAKRQPMAGKASAETDENIHPNAPQMEIVADEEVKQADESAFEISGEKFSNKNDDNVFEVRQEELDAARKELQEQEQREKDNGGVDRAADAENEEKYSGPRFH